MNHLVISQVYTQGGSVGATYSRDYVELFNPTSGSINLTSHFLGYWSATGGSGGQLALSGSVGAHQYFLVALASGANGAALPTADQSATSPNLAAAAGRVVLYTGTSTTTIPAPNAANVVDFVGYGTTAATFEGGGPAGVPSLTNALHRTNSGCTDTNVNSADLVVTAAAPRNSSSPVNYCGPSKLSIPTIATQTAGSPFSLTVTARDANDVARNVFTNTTVALTTNGNAGTLNGTVVGQINAGSSAITFSGLSFASSGMGVTITATASLGDALTAAISNTFIVNAAAANDCNGVPGGPDVPGSPCIHPDPCVVGETWDLSCQCIGTAPDSDNDGTCDTNDGCPNDPLKIAAGACGCGNLEVGATCNDNNACTGGDVITSCGVCAGSALVDTDGDGTCDAVDECDNDPLKILAGACGCGSPEVGATCNDGNANTINDQIVSCGVCQGSDPYVYWDFVTATPTTELLVNATVSAVSQGNNNGTTTMLVNGSVSSGYTGASGTWNANAAARIGALNTGASGSAYFEFTVDADALFSTTITSIRFGTRSTGTGPQAYTLRSSMDGFTADILSGTIANNSAWSLKSHSGLSISSLSGGLITFRLYGHSGAGSPVAGTSNWRIDDLNVTGTSVFSPILPVVGFIAPASSANENAGPLSIPVRMDIAPDADVTVDVTDAGTGTGVNGVDYTFSPTTLTFSPSGVYPDTQYVSLSPVNEAVYDADYTVHLELAITGGTAVTSLDEHTVTVANDDLPSLVINEVDYDQPSDDLAEFVEILNTGAAPVDLNGLKLVLVNGTNNTAYAPNITLGNVILAAGDYYVVGSANVPNVDLVVFNSTLPVNANLAMQNGAPDGVRLTTAANIVIDQMSYEGAMASTEGTTAPTDNGNALGLSRVPDGTDSNDNSVDFILTCLTPGATNDALDSDDDGTPDCLDVCPAGPEPGSACDDGDEDTGDDTVQADCSCAGVAIDCEGVAGGTALPGTPCIDGNPGTLNDTYQTDCTCLGQIPDCLGVLGGTALPGTACNDFIPSTNDETYDSECACVGTPCSQNVTLEIRSDANSAQVGWEIIYQNDGTVVCSGGTLSTPYINGITTPITEPCCLPVGCFRLRVHDSGGDGFVSGGVTGGYQLRESGANGRRIIDNFGNFSSGSLSGIANTFDNGAFCVPMGNDRPIFSSCDKLDWVNDRFIVATENSAVSGQYNVSNATSGYEFWFFDPNGSYSFRRFRNHATTDGSGTGATRACHFRINSWTNTVSTPHLPSNVLLNVRIRGRVAGINQPFGPACLFKIDAARAACPLVKLQDNPADADFSCGVSKVFGGSNSSANKLVAAAPQFTPTVASSNVRYQFRFRIPGEYPNAGSCIVRPMQTSPTIYLNWATGDKLKCNTTYAVEVRVSKDGGATWCIANAAPTCASQETIVTWGKVCNVNITTSTYCPLNAQGSGVNMIAQGDGELNLYPNPNRGDQLYMSLSKVPDGVSTVSIDLYDITGKRTMARTIAVQDGSVNTSLLLNGDLAGGVYLVNITAGDTSYTQRLVIQP
ncbi:MAG: lamin tail domain-containing protein [Flavobacteriales bacterium]|nr:lamin tail domain-containing protein [Flavobacteriales bacterium]